MNTPLTVGVLFGGKSAEHDVSIRSAQSIVNAMDKTKYTPIMLKIGQDGVWMHDNTPIALIPESRGRVINAQTGEQVAQLDVVFPVLHGPFGEDGTVQGLLRLTGVPFVGSGVLGSAVGMDKDVMKRLLRDAGVPIGKWITLESGVNTITFESAAEQLGLPIFVKPANLGSSIGVSKVNTPEEFERAIQDAFQYDIKILLEEYIECREIECAVLGNTDMQASLPGEVKPTHDFYSYDAKYIDEQGATFQIPVELPAELTKQIQEIAIQTCRVLNCFGLSRVDFFLTPEGRVYVNEINTIPGFTSISMYPKLWEASGIGYTELIDRLIQFALEQFHTQDQLKHTK